jgi:hypothetical protein
VEQELEKQEDTTEVEPTVETPEQATVSNDTEDTTPEVETEPKEEMVSKKELEELKKEFEKAELRKNQLENELKRTQEVAKDAGNEDEVARLQAKLDEIEADREREQLDKQVKEFESEMDGVFNKVIADYPREVQVAAKFNKEKLGIGAIVGEVQYGFQAEKNIKEYLDGMSDGFKDLSKPEIKIDATNPSITPSLSEKALIESELAKPEKDRDYSKILSKRLGKRM